jgi:hypothetical protein
MWMTRSWRRWRRSSNSGRRLGSGKTKRNEKTNRTDRDLLSHLWIKTLPCWRFSWLQRTGKTIKDTEICANKKESRR